MTTTDSTRRRPPNYRAVLAELRGQDGLPEYEPGQFGKRQVHGWTAIPSAGDVIVVNTRPNTSVQRDAEIELVLRVLTDAGFYAVMNRHGDTRPGAIRVTAWPSQVQKGRNRYPNETRKD